VLQIQTRHHSVLQALTIANECKDKVSSAYAMKAYLRRIRSEDLLIFNLGTKSWWVVKFGPGHLTATDRNSDNQLIGGWAKFGRGLAILKKRSVFLLFGYQTLRTFLTLTYTLRTLHLSASGPFTECIAADPNLHLTALLHRFISAKEKYVEARTELPLYNCNIVCNVHIVTTNYTTNRSCTGIYTHDCCTKYPPS